MRTRDMPATTFSLNFAMKGTPEAQHEFARELIKIIEDHALGGARLDEEIRTLWPEGMRQVTFGCSWDPARP
jgi:hypothetical protein